MEQETNNTFEYVNNEENKIIENNPTVEEENKKDNQSLTQDFVTGLPSWDLEPPYEVVRRVNR